MRRFIQGLLLRRKKFGPAPRFAPEDAVRALWRLEKRTGRAALARSLGIGEGTVRTVIDSMSAKGLVDSAPMGHKLTAKGFALLSNLKENVLALKGVPASRLTFGFTALAMHLRGLHARLDSLALRDEMVRSGLAGCTVLRFEGGRLIIPPFHAPTHSRYASELESLSRLFELREGDIVLIGYGGNRAGIERGLWRACSLLHI